MKALVKAQKTAIGQKNKEIQQMTAEKDSLIKKIGNLELETSSTTFKLGKLKEDVAEAEKIVNIVQCLIVNLFFSNCIYLQ